MQGWCLKTVRPRKGEILGLQMLQTFSCTLSILDQFVVKNLLDPHVARVDSARNTYLLRKF